MATINELVSRWLSGMTNGAARARPITGTGQPDKNRNINAAASAAYAQSTNSCAWTSTENMTEFFVTCTAAAAGTGDSVLMLMDPPSEAYCTSAFADTGGRSVDVDYRRLPYNVRLGPFTGVSYFSSLAFLPSINSTKITVEAQ